LAKRKKSDAAPDLFAAAGEGSPGEKIAAGIDSFLLEKKTPQEYKNFIIALFKDSLACGQDDAVWKLLDYLENESDFFTAPASTRFHGAEECGLVIHSLLVLSKCLRLAPVMLGAEFNVYHLALSCVFHDLCKVNMYDKKTRNVKNEKTGAWEVVPCYVVRNDYIAYGHGIESMLRLNKFIKMPAAWNHAIRWHMGAYDISDSDHHSYKKALAFYREVLLLHSADMLAATVEGV
jgi:hypothetical protein